ncbi:MAG: arsenate reductase ArsC [Verrucomicrobia bacterium]|nr:MAG: arsenate reductase ArsC [Verrucomicrobiota bacterium]
MKKEKVLFVCVHNSARSQMAEAFLNRICGGQFDAQSAGLEPGKLNPIVVEVMREIGFDLSGNRTKAVSTLLEAGQHFDWVITVCDESSAERCPVFPGPARRLHWRFPDPSSFQGTHEEKLARTRKVREAIKERIERWCAEICPLSAVGTNF